VHEALAQVPSSLKLRWVQVREGQGPWSYTSGEGVTDSSFMTVQLLLTLAAQDAGEVP
jgi:hypothetical protein